MRLAFPHDFPAPPAPQLHRWRSTRPRGRRDTDIVDPSTAQVVAKAPVSGQSDVDGRTPRRRPAFETWGDTTPCERQAALLKFADVIESRAEDLIRLEVENTGKPYP